MENKTPKARYESPKIEEHGDVSKITLQGSSANADTQAGVPNTAYPVS